MKHAASNVHLSHEEEPVTEDARSEDAAKITYLLQYAGDEYTHVRLDGATPPRCREKISLKNASALTILITLLKIASLLSKDVCMPALGF